MKKDKETVLDEVWTESRVREFLDSEPKAGTNRDFHALLKAYQSMRAEDFELFIGMFLEAGRDLNELFGGYIGSCCSILCGEGTNLAL